MNAHRASAIALATVVSLLSLVTRESIAQQPSQSPVTSAAAVHIGGDSMFVPILVYHSVMPHHPGQTPEQIAYDVAPENFDTQMAYLRDHQFHVISFGALVEAIESGRQVPEKSVVITFDDGRENQYAHAFPILQKYGYTATFFVYPNPVGKKDEFMTWEQIRELVKAGMTIGSHSQTHEYLTKITDAKQMKWQVETSRTNLEKNLGIKIEYFAYPFGAKNPSVIETIEKAGYRAARAFPGGTWQGKSNLFALKGLQIRDSMKSFAAMIEQRPAAKKSSLHP